MRLTPNHNIILYEIDPAHQEAINSILHEHGIITNPEEIDPLIRYSMACPAFPTCGLAITESERALPGIIDRIRTLLEQLGMADEQFVIRMTGCPNGCARPYMAELGFVGSNPGTYQIWLGGDPNQTVLAQTYIDKLPFDQIETFLEPIFVYFKENKTSGESFGTFCRRVGFDALREFSESYQLGSYQKMNKKTTKPRRVRKNQNRVSVPDDMFIRLKQASQDEGRPMNQIVTEALEAYLSGKS